MDSRERPTAPRLIKTVTSGAVGSWVFVDHTEQGSEVTDVGIVTEKELRDVAKTETRLFLRGRVFADVAVGHGALGRDDSQAIRVVG
jgi:hypothetical protein